MNCRGIIIKQGRNRIQRGARVLQSLIRNQQNNVFLENHVTVEKSTQMDALVFALQMTF